MNNFHNVNTAAVNYGTAQVVGTNIDYSNKKRKITEDPPSPLPTSPTVLAPKSPSDRSLSYESSEELVSTH